MTQRKHNIAIYLTLNAYLKPLKSLSSNLTRCYVQYHVYLCKKIGGGSHAYDIIHIHAYDIIHIKPNF